MNRHHADDAEVPHNKEASWPIHWNVVSAQDFLHVEIREEKKQHERRQNKPAVDDVVATFLIQENQEEGHDDNHNQENQA